MRSLAHVHKKQLMMAEKLAFLPTISVFADWARTRLVQLAYIMVEIEVERSSVIFHQGDPCDCLLILKQGSAKEVVKAPQTNPYKSELTHRMSAGDIEIGLRTTGSFLGEVGAAGDGSVALQTYTTNSPACLFLSPCTTPTPTPATITTTANVTQTDVGSRKKHETTCIASSNCKLYMIDIDAHSKFLKRSYVDNARLLTISKSRKVLAEQRVKAVSEFRANNPGMGGARPTRKGLKPLRRGRASPTRKKMSKFLTYEELSGQ